jgi:hypothetical protein
MQRTVCISPEIHVIAWKAFADHKELAIRMTSQYRKANTLDLMRLHAHQR